MGLIEQLMGLLFGGGLKGVRETVEVFRPNAEKSASRQADAASKSLEQFAAEFAGGRTRGTFDRVMDGVNRLPRPALALGTLALLGAAMVDPLWFGARMQGLALVPEPLWWLLGAIVSFYFGARHQVKSQDFQKGLTEMVARAPQVVEAVATLNGEDGSKHAPGPTRPAKPDVNSTSSANQNAALNEWRRSDE